MKEQCIFEGTDTDEGLMRISIKLRGKLRKFIEVKNE